ncbi:MAG TPA: Ppx/GppA phosphatase family protein [Candidatus Acidoferrales bacterium]|nr:Ppx/GppA phosphatase family protein [Candidatus Acidoferrales bacterium]
MPNLAAIDVGSNAIRLSIASVDGERKLSSLENLREPVRLGQDVFAKGLITDNTLEQAVDAFKKFKEAIDRNGVNWSKAVATSAVREAANRDMFIDSVAQRCGIDIVVIEPEEEARLIHLAIASKVNLKNKTAMLIDIGGGSTEVTLTADGSIVSTESYRMGAVRLLQLLSSGVSGKEKRNGEKEFNQLVREYVESTQRRLKREIGGKKINICVGTGGNIETLGGLRKDLLGKERETSIELGELDAILKKLQALSFEERIQQLKMRPDRADVIVPASIILQQIAKLADVDEILIPKVGLKEGILINMVIDLYEETKHAYRDQVMASALEIGRKYFFDEQHGTSVARYAVELFDQTRNLHNLSLEHRLLLEVAALLHDIGNFISATDHHKHAQYLLAATPVIGLGQLQMAIIANVARYHRKSFPKQQHEAYSSLPSKDRVAVTKLAAVLRLADAMDNEHASRVESFSVEYKKPKFAIHLKGQGDLLLEKWALMKKAEMFEEVFGVKVVVED